MAKFGVMSKEFIKIGGAREHNLKNLTLEIPRDKLVVITGLSGSGKSSLAFDTIYAEGQRAALNATFLRQNRRKLFVNHVARFGKSTKTFRARFSRCVTKDNAVRAHTKSVVTVQIALECFHISFPLREKFEASTEIAPGLRR